MKAILFLLLTMLLASTLSAPAEYEVTSLPGLKGPLPSKMYSGFTKCGPPPGDPRGMMHMHWVFIESELVDPKHAPLVVWYNGGPGASSLFGLLVELGPFMLNVDSLGDEYNRTGVPTLLPNPYSWTKVANVLVVNNPPPVGFSYCDPAGPAGKGTACGTWNDDLVAKTNLAFLTTWMSEQFPEYALNDLYITGESYAGIYVPVIVREILNSNVPLNLKGFAVGDGCMGLDVLCGPKDGPYYLIEFLHGHGQFSNALYKQIMATCSEKELMEGGLSPACDALVKQMDEEVGGYFAYNIYDECVYEQSFDTPVIGEVRTSWTHAQQLGAAQNDYPCPGAAMPIWLNLTSVRAALNVPLNDYFFNGDNGAGFNYVSTERNVLPFYLHVAKNTDLRVLVYQGDTDPGLNSFVTQDKYFDYFNKNGLKQTKKWRPWTLDGKQMMGGYVTEYEGDFTYLTIRGSGHMVPEFKPAAALELLTRWLHNQEPAPYRPPKTAA